MSQDNEALVSRVAERETLTHALTAAQEGATRLITLQGADGSGRRALLGEVIKDSAAEDLLPLRLHFSEGEDGLRVLLRLYASLYRGLDQRPTLKEAVSARVEARLADEEALTEPMKLWLNAFKEGMEKEVPNTDAPTFQVTVPRASPYMGLVELISLVGQDARFLIEVGEAQRVLSFAFWTFLTSILGRSLRDERGALFVLWYAPFNQAETEGKSVSMVRNFLKSLPEGLEHQALSLDPLSTEELQEMLQGRHPGIDADGAFLDALTELSDGLPGRVTEILDRLAALGKLSDSEGQWTLSATPADLSPEALLPPLPDKDQGRARRALQIAALEGRVFTSAVVSDALELKKDQVDDLLDELDDHLEEVVFHEGLQSWLYRFQSPLYQRLVLTDLSNQAREVQARSLAELLERRYVRRSPEYASKGARLWRDAGEPSRANRLLGLASSMERPDILQMGFEIFHSDPDSPYSAPLARGMMLSLLEKLASQGNAQLGQQVVNRLEAWAEANDAPDLDPWIAQYKARFAHRTGRRDEAQKLADQARSGFAKANNTIKEAESLALLASIELGRNEPGKALEYAQRAIKETDFVPVQAQSRFIKGLVHKSRGELQPAVEELRQVLELSARAGMFPLHADAGINLGESLLMGNNPAAAINLLEQLINFTRQHKMRNRERGVLSLLAKGKGALKEYTDATNYASDALKISREMKNRLAEASDLFDLGMFSYLQGKLDEAQIYLKEAEHSAREVKHQVLLGEILFHQALAASATRDTDKAREAYLEAEQICRATGNQRRLTTILFNLGAIYLHEAQLDKARAYLDEAKPMVEQWGSDADKKNMRKARRQLEQRLH